MAHKKSTSFPIGLPSSFLIAFAVCGWLILLGNLFPIARATTGIFPVVDDLAGLIMSTLIFLILGLTPAMIRSMFSNQNSSKKDTSSGNPE